MTNTNQPLYKQLNEKRTQGDCISANDGKALLQKNHSRWDKIAEFEHEPTTQYAALAINNLHILAEALENVLWNFEGKQNLSEVQQKAVQYAKEALNRIS